MNLSDHRKKDGTFNLCGAFYEHMNKKRKGVTHFTPAILWLERRCDREPVTEYGTAMILINQAMSMAYGRLPIPFPQEIIPYEFKTKRKTEEAEDPDCWWSRVIVVEAEIDNERLACT